MGQRIVVDGGRNVKDDASAPIRAFVAVELPASLRAVLGTHQTAFGGQSSTLKWVHPDLLHITVRFLGNVAQNRIDAIKEGLSRAVDGIGPFDLEVAGLGAFPNARVPRVIWVGVGGPGFPVLEETYRHVEERLADAGFPPENRPFSPHITLARARENATTQQRRQVGDILARVQEKSRKGDTFTVDHVTLMRSTLRPSGPLYTPLFVVPLQPHRKGA